MYAHRLHLILRASLVMVLATAAASAAESPRTTPDNKIVASQGDIQVTLGDVDAFANTVPVSDRATLFASPQRIESVLRNLLSEKQLLHEARELKLQDKPSVKAAMRQAADGALVKARVNQLRTEATSRVPDMAELAHERYLSNPQDYAVPKRIDVKHILISTKDRKDAEAKAMAEKLYSALQSDPSQFDADVDKYSDDPSKAANHGLISDATSNRVVEPFKQAASTLHKVGELGGPFKTRFGYHIIKAERIVPGHQRSFAEVKDELVKKLRKEWIDRQVQNHLDDLRSEKIDANPDLVAALRTRYASSDSADGKDEAPKPKASNGHPGNK